MMRARAERGQIRRSFAAPLLATSAAGLLRVGYCLNTTASSSIARIDAAAASAAARLS